MIINNVRTEKKSYVTIVSSVSNSCIISNVRSGVSDISIESNVSTLGNVSTV